MTNENDVAKYLHSMLR